MRRRDRPTPHHPLPHHHLQRRKRRQPARQHVHSLLLAGAAFFAPHAGAPPPPRPSPPIKLIAVEKTDGGLVTTTSEFRLGGMPKEDAYDAVIKEASRRYGLSVALIRAIIRTESAFDPLAVSRAGAQGLMQLMPALSRDLGVKDPFDPRQNVMAGTRYMSALLAEHNGNLALALASYNAGPGNVEKYRGIPPFKETRHYVERITRLVGMEVLNDD